MTHHADCREWLSGFADLKEVTRGDDAVVRRVAADLLNQQLWCWGYDVQGEGANLLLEYGFARTKPPSDRENCSSVYRRELPGGARVVLRGFGVFFGRDRWGGLFVPRYAWEPRLTPAADLTCPPWRDADMPPCRAPHGGEAPRATFLLQELLRWIPTYEAWVVGRRGVPYRQRAIAAWKYGRRAPFPFEVAIALWPRLQCLLMERSPTLLPTGDPAEPAPSPSGRVGAVRYEPSTPSTARRKRPRQASGGARNMTPDALQATDGRPSAVAPAPPRNRRHA